MSIISRFIKCGVTVPVLELIHLSFFHSENIVYEWKNSRCSTTHTCPGTDTVTLCLKHQQNFNEMEIASHIRVFKDLAYLSAVYNYKDDTMFKCLDYVDIEAFVSLNNENGNQFSIYCCRNIAEALCGEWLQLFVIWKKAKKEKKETENVWLNYRVDSTIRWYKDIQFYANSKNFVLSFRIKFMSTVSIKISIKFDILIWYEEWNFIDKNEAMWTLYNAQKFFLCRLKTFMKTENILIYIIVYRSDK